MLAWIVLFSTIASIGSIGAASLALTLKEEARTKYIPWMVAYATGTLLASAIIGLIPEALEHGTVAEPEPLFYTFLFAILGYFVLEKAILWHHCHDQLCEERKKIGSMILVGDGIHNIVDGILIAASFLSSIELGIAVSIAVIIHEVAQEVGDFAILINSGYPRKKALLANLISNLTMVAGSIIAYFALEAMEAAEPYIVIISAASFIYIALADLSPELHHHKPDVKQVLLQLAFITIGIVTVLLLLSIHAHGH
ncbi:MAG: ZIP family metal transporter [Candidatus Sigynarchaeota archaeon]